MRRTLTERLSEPGLRLKALPLGSKVALGVIALYLLTAVEVTSLAMKRLPRRTWRGIHRMSYLLFWIATLHGVSAGTDATHPAYWAANMVAATAVVFLTAYRLLAERTVRQVVRGSANQGARVR